MLIPPRKVTQQIPSSVKKSSEGDQLFMKYGQALFKLRSIDKEKVTQRVQNLLNSYPCWFLKQSLVQSEDFVQIKQEIVEAHPKELYIFEENQLKEKKGKILTEVGGIKFTNLKVLHIMLVAETSFQQISWLDAPVLQEIYLSSQGAFNSVKPLQKSNFKNLTIINFRSSDQNSKLEARCLDVSQFSRTKFLSYTTNQPPKAKLYKAPGTVNITRMDYSNMFYMAKLQIQKLTNFHIPHLTLPNNHHHFAPNAEYPWCPQIQFTQCKLYKVLNQKFDNRTISLSIIDYVFGDMYDDDIVNGGWIQRGENQVENEVDSDLDVGLEDVRGEMKKKDNREKQDWKEEF